MTPRSARPAWAEPYRDANAEPIDRRDNGSTPYDFPIIGKMLLTWRIDQRMFGEIVTLHWRKQDRAQFLKYQIGWTMCDLDEVSDRYRDDEAWARLVQLINDVIRPKDETR